MTENEREELQDLRLFAIAAPMLRPLLEKRKRAAFEQMRREFKDGRTDHTARVAELSVLADLETELNLKENHYRSLEERYAKSTDPNRK